MRLLMRAWGPEVRRVHLPAFSVRIYCLVFRFGYNQNPAARITRLPSVAQIHGKKLLHLLVVVGGMAE